MHLRHTALLLAALVAAAPLAHARKPLLGGVKTLELAPDGTIPGRVVGAELGQGGYLRGVRQVVVPLVAVAFETNAKASITHSNSSQGTLSTKSLNSHLLIDERVLQDIADEMQAVVERELAAQGFAVLPRESVDTEARYAGIEKSAPTGVEVGDNFMSGFAGTGTKNRWFTAGRRGLFGTGPTASLGETSPLIHLARERREALLFYRFKIQFADIDAGNGVFSSHVKGRNVLHLASADLVVFSPEKTNGGMLKLKADVTAGAEFVQAVQELPKDPSSEAGLQMSAMLNSLLSGNATTAMSGKHSGHYAIVANPERYKSDSLLLLAATARQFAEALRAAQ